MESEIKSKQPYVWKAIVGLLFAFFVASVFMVLNTLSSQMPVGEVIAWTTTILTFLGIVATLFYGLVIDRITILIKEVTNHSKIVATKHDLEVIETKVETASKIITEAYDIATKDLVKEAQRTGFTMIYKDRSSIANELSEQLEHSRREVKALGICITMPSEIAGFREIIQKKAKDGVSFQFAYLKRPSVEGDIDFYQQRSLDEHFPDSNIGTLEVQTTNAIESLSAIRENLEGNTKRKIEIREYSAFPYMSMTIIDDTIFVGPYLFGVNCPIIPMFKIVKKHGGIYRTYYKHFEKLWKSCQGNEIC